MKLRNLSAWGLSLAIHASALITVGAMTLAGGRPAQPGVTEIAITLAAPPAPQPAAPAAQPRAVAKPAAKPAPKPVVRSERPAPQPQPQPQVAETAPQPAQPKASTTQTLAQGAKGRAGDPGKGADQSGDTENALNLYLAKVRDTIDYHKRYPQRAKIRRQQGIVKVSFEINARGYAEKVSVAQSSGSQILDRATRDLLSRLRFQAPPKDLKSIPVAVTVPVEYNLRNG